MSWSIEVTGTKEAVKRKACDELAKIGASYAGKPEGDDIATVSARIVALVDALELTATYTGVSVKASGSHNAYASGGVTSVVSAQFSLAVNRVPLAL